MLAQQVKEIDLVGRRMVKQPKDFHAEDIKLLFPFLLERKYHLLVMDASWNEFFEQIKGKDYAKSLHAFLQEEYGKHTCYPPREMMFKAFELTPAEKVKAVIVGQDPYSNPHQAMGLCFSVPKGVVIPPSLVNVYTDLQDELVVRRIIVAVEREGDFAGRGGIEDFPVELPSCFTQSSGITGPL